MTTTKTPRFISVNYNGEDITVIFDYTEGERNLGLLESIDIYKIISEEKDRDITTEFIPYDIEEIEQLVWDEIDKM